MQSMLS